MLHFLSFQAWASVDVRTAQVLNDADVLTVQLDQDFVALLEDLHRPVKEALAS